MSQNRVILIGCVCAIVGLGIGIGFGSLINSGSSESPPSPPKEDPNAAKTIMDEIKAANIEQNLKILTENPHIAGRSVDEEDLVNFIANRWKSSEISVEIHPYDVLLSYPNQEDSNYLAIKQSNGTLTEQSNPVEEILDPSQNKSGVVNPFNAFSAPGDVEGELVYVNYATIDDFLFLKDKNFDLTNKICISRYGKIFRGDKAAHAQEYNCSGLILYSDPADYTVEGEPVYPESWYLPGTGAQRGTLWLGQGDPLTLHYPSFDTAWRSKEEDTDLPKIPVTPVGYDDAIKYLSKMGGDEVETAWQGGLNITYRYGPGFTGTHSSSEMFMHVTTTNQRVTIHNVIGYIRGHEEPDRYVLIGNHRDAWVFGAMDPSSGTAGMLEVSRAIGEAVKQGWKPRRTIVFCSWGGEEHGLVGSTEWVEEFQKNLGARAVAYINVDTMITGGYTFSSSAMPHLKQLIYDATSALSNPDPAEVAAGRTTVYDTYLERRRGTDGKPSVGISGSGSDHTMFIQLPGVSILNAQYTYDTSIGLASYPVYHSVYETFDLVKSYVDPEFKYHETCSKVVAELARRLADSPVLPFKVVDYAEKMKSDMDTFYSNEDNEDSLKAQNIDTEQLRKALDNFTAAAESLQERINDVDLTNTLGLRALNDQAMYLDRAFIDKQGIAGRDQFSHVIYAPSQHNAYGGAAFPGLSDSLFEIDNDPDPDARWEEVRRQYAILLYHIGSAASTLRDVVPMKGYSNG